MSWTFLGMFALAFIFWGSLSQLIKWADNRLTSKFERHTT